jgi:hypothetical protein
VGNGGRERPHGAQSHHATDDIVLLHDRDHRRDRAPDRQRHHRVTSHVTLQHRPDAALGDDLVDRTGRVVVGGVLPLRAGGGERHEPAVARSDVGDGLDLAHDTVAVRRLAQVERAVDLEAPSVVESGEKRLTAPPVVDLPDRGPEVDVMAHDLVAGRVQGRRLVLGHLHHAVGASPAIVGCR